jgi:hypothetical protein
MEFEKSKEDEVKAAYVKFKKARRRARKKGKTMPIDSIAGQAFELFSSDYIDGSDNTLYGTKRAEFYCLDEDDLYEDDDIEISGTNGKKVAREGKQIYGDVYFDTDANCNFGPIPVPIRARRKDVKVKSENGKYDLRSKFFGNGYLKLSVSWDLAFMGGYNSRLFSQK